MTGNEHHEARSMKPSEARVKNDRSPRAGTRKAEAVMPSRVRSEPVVGTASRARALRRSLPAVEIRCPDGPGIIDEICASDCSIHIEQMDAAGWYMGIEAKDGSYWQFWFGSKNRRAPVEFRHTEMSPAEVEKKRRRVGGHR